MCHRSGVVSPLYSVSLSSGTLSGLCSNPSCVYPFDSYSGLLHSLAAVAPADTNPGQISVNSQSFVEGLPEALSEAPNQVQQGEHHVISQVGGLLDKTYGLHEAHGTSSSLSTCTSAQKPCAILPRYLADSLKQGTSLCMHCHVRYLY